MGISGAMRRDKLTKLTFTVTNPEFVRLYRKYAALVPCTHPELKKYYKLCSVAFKT
jgi:hypothetical protein